MQTDLVYILLLQEGRRELEKQEKKGNKGLISTLNTIYLSSLNSLLHGLSPLVYLNIYKSQFLISEPIHGIHT